MALGLSVLGSGSRGNATLVELDGAGILLDVGLGRRAITARLEHVGSGWDGVLGALITHTHSDHARDVTLRWLARRRLFLHCHDAHVDELGHRPGFRELAARGLVRTFDDRPFLVAPGLWVEPIELSHSGPTFGFRLQGRSGRRGRPSTVGYLTDLGCWDHPIAEALTDVDLLGVEFNHDVPMERSSGRAPALIARNLGPHGHLSNDQGAGLLEAVLERSGPGAVRQIVLLHLSEDCNRPELAVGIARSVLQRSGRRAVVHAASQSIPVGHLRVRPGRRPRATAVAGFPWESADAS